MYHSNTNGLNKKQSIIRPNQTMINEYEIDKKSEKKKQTKKKKKDILNSDKNDNGYVESNVETLQKDITQDHSEKQKKKKKKKKNKGSELSYNVFQESEVGGSNYKEDSAESENKDDLQHIKLQSVSSSFTVELISEEPKKKKKKVKTETNEECKEEISNGVEPLKSVKDDKLNLIKFINGEHKSATSSAIKINNEEYYPGMLSNLLQLNKFGRLIAPWDPSFGLDPNYKLPERREGDPDLKINPLFDLSKRTIEKCQQSEDAKEKSVFLGNLPSDMKIIEIKKLFRKCGLIDHVKVRSGENIPKRLQSQKKENAEDKESKPKNAVVRFHNADSCKMALELNGTLHQGHHIRVTLVHREAPDVDTTNRTVFVGNLSFKAQDEDLWTFFQSCGSIESVRVVRDNQTKQCRGFGYVNFKSAESVELALKQEGTALLGRNIRVRRATSESKVLADTASVQKWKKKKKKFTSKKNSINNENKCKSDDDDNFPSECDIRVDKMQRHIFNSNSPVKSNEDIDMPDNAKNKKHKKKSKINALFDDSNMEDKSIITKKHMKKKKKSKYDNPKPESE